jgi:hypothetical protein
MSTVFIAVTLDSGAVSVMQFVTVGRYLGDQLPSGAVPTNDARFWLREPTEANVAAEIAKTFASGYDEKVVSWRRIESKELPTDRQFRDAWTDNGAAVVHDMAKARAIHMREIRYVRDFLLEASDYEAVRAAEQKADTSEILARRQALRDFPATVQAAVDAAENIEALKAIALPE